MCGIRLQNSHVRGNADDLGRVAGLDENHGGTRARSQCHHVTDLLLVTVSRLANLTRPRCGKSNRPESRTFLLSTKQSFFNLPPFVSLSVGTYPTSSTGLHSRVQIAVARGQWDLEESAEVCEVKVSEGECLRACRPPARYSSGRPGQTDAPGTGIDGACERINTEGSMTLADRAHACTG